MDRTVKILLGMIAASLFMLNIQLAGGSLVSEAHAELDASDARKISRSIDGVKHAINAIDCN